MADGGGEIIIRGGSCEIHYDESLYKKDKKDPLRHEHKHKDVKIERIEIKGARDFHSYDIPGGFKGDIKIIYSYPKRKR